MPEVLTTLPLLSLPCMDLSKMEGFFGLAPFCHAAQSIITVIQTALLNVFRTKSFWALPHA
jgi:hypothetical protein